MDSEKIERMPDQTRRHEILSKVAWFLAGGPVDTLVSSVVDRDTPGTIQDPSNKGKNHNG